MAYACRSTCGCSVRPSGKRVRVEDAAGVPGRQCATPAVEEHRVGRALSRDEHRPPAGDVLRHGCARGLADRYATDLRALAEDGDEPPADVAIRDRQPAALAHAQPGAVEQLEHRDVAARERARDRIVALSGQCRRHRGLRVVEHRYGLGAAGNPRQAGLALRRAQRAAGVHRHRAVPVQIAEVGADGRGLARH